MTTGSCEVSVLVPAYNSAATLGRAVRSVLVQQSCDLELLIINDASQDRTGHVARELAAEDPRIRVITLSRNRGKPFAMNAGIAQSRGEWVAVLDADDWYEPDRLCCLIQAGEACGADLVADNQYLYDEGAGLVVRTAFTAGEAGRPLDKAAFIAGSDPYSDFDFGMLKPLVRRDFIRASGLSYHENARLSEDFLYMVEFLAAGGRGWLISRPLYYWSQAFGSISRCWTETGAGRWRYDFLSAAEANAEVLHAMQQAGESELAVLLQRRMRAFQRLHWVQEVNRMRADGAPATQLARQVLSHPSIWSLVARRGIRRAAKVLTPNSLVRA